jgi:hypothetical protein
MPEPEAWHASGLTSLLRCGVAYYRRYIAHEGQPPTTPQLRGTAVHRGIGMGLLAQQRTGTPAPVDLFEDIAASEIDRARHGGATFTSDERSVGAARTFGALKDKAVRLAGGYGRIVAPTVRPIAVERRITVADLVPGAVLRGTIDHVDGAEGGEIIRDVKTSERAPSRDAADRSQQLTMYDVLRSADRADPVGSHRVALDYMVLHASTGMVTHVRLDSTRDAADRASMLARVEVGMRAVKAGVFLPANPETDWWCSERWCEFAPTCPYFLGRRGAVSP